jgi:hypothetical protein
MDSLIKGPMPLTDDLGIAPGSSYFIPLVTMIIVFLDKKITKSI